MAGKKVMKENPKTRFELRFDTDVYESVARLADEVGVSLNQLMQGITRWAVANAHPGEFVGDHVRDASGDPLVTRDQPGVVWFANEEDNVPCFELDFTERRVVRERPAGKSEVKRARK
jgi:hypothetical protein